MSSIEKLACRTAAVTASLFFFLSVLPVYAQTHSGHGAAPPQAPRPQPTQPQAAEATNYDQQLKEIFQRMMADPVIRERVATDPVLQRMLQSAGIAQTSGLPGAQEMPGMDHRSMQMPADATAADQQRAFDFIVRLLSDRTVASEINDKDRLRRLWADPDVQRRLADLRSERR